MKPETKKRLEKYWRRFLLFAYPIVLLYIVYLDPMYLLYLAFGCVVTLLALACLLHLARYGFPDDRY